MSFPARFSRSMPVALGAVAIVGLLGLVQQAAAQPLDPNDFTSLGVLDPSSGTVDVDTSGSSPEMTGAVSFTGVEDNGIAVFTFDSVDVASGVVFDVTGDQPLAILSHDTLIFAGEIDVAASGTSGGPGASQGGDGATAAGAGDGDGAGDGTTGGASGAGHGGTGGAAVSGPLGGSTYGDLSTTLVGGSGGGMSSFGSSANGGGGGGAVQLGAVNDITFEGEINASGAAGLPGGGDDGGGGGSGGAIIVHSMLGNVDATGTLNAAGGNGGSGFFGGGGGGGGRILLQGVSVNAPNTDVSGGAAGAGNAPGAGSTGVVDEVILNQAPILDNSGDPYLNNAFDGVLPVGGTTVEQLLSRGAGGDPISDPNTGDPRGIAIIDADDTGTWEFSTAAAPPGRRSPAR